jgi:hypothetical protein
VVFFLVDHVGARWNELVSELDRWHEFGKARETAQKTVNLLYVCRVE